MPKQEALNDYRFLYGRGLGSYNNLENKDRQTQYYISYMFNRTRRMFEWKNLPESLSERHLELYLQSIGHTAIAEHENKLYAFFGSFGGFPNAYYMPQKYIVANPYLKLNEEFTIGEDCIVIPNDTMYMGLLPLAENFASRMVDTDISIRVATIMSRAGAAITSGDDNTKKAAEKFIRDLEDGKLSHIGANSFMNSVSSIPLEERERTISQLIELRQYTKASWFNDVGINANYNMKREAVNSNEAEMDNDSLLPLCDDMLANRQSYAEKINEMFPHLLTKGEISVDFSSAWKKMRDANELEMRILEKESSQLDNSQEGEEVQNETE